VQDSGQRCTHPWLRVTCGVCGDAVDALGESLLEAASGGDASTRAADRGAGREHSQATFIVARGHPELIDQLRALLGHESGVEVIEDRRQRPREERSPEEVRELRKRLRDEGEGG
jgi:hypothetical protein